MQIVDKLPECNQASREEQLDDVDEHLLVFFEAFFRWLLIFKIHLYLGESQVDHIDERQLKELQMLLRFGLILNFAGFKSRDSLK